MRDMTRRVRTYKQLSILKLFVMFSSGLSSVCHFGHDGEIVGVTLRLGTWRGARWLNRWWHP
jgi:putative effector of murein hydrolase LrgA (UPF0299 family)